MQTGRILHLPASIDASWRVGIVYSSHYEEETCKLVDAAKKTLIKGGLKETNVTLHAVPGAFEIPLLGAALAAEERVDGLIALGIIVEGETHHADLIAKEAARGVMDVQVQFRVPFAFEVLYVRKLTQAKARSAGGSNKGEEAAVTVLYSLAQLRRLQS